MWCFFLNCPTYVSLVSTLWIYIPKTYAWIVEITTFILGFIFIIYKDTIYSYCHGPGYTNIQWVYKAKVIFCNSMMMTRSMYLVTYHLPVGVTFPVPISLVDSWYPLQITSDDPPIRERIGTKILTRGANQPMSVNWVCFSKLNKENVRWSSS